MSDNTPKRTNENDYHVFTHDSEFLKQLNLNTFTTGTWMQFWHTRNAEDTDYQFRKLFLHSPVGFVGIDTDADRQDWDTIFTNDHPFHVRYLGDELVDYSFEHEILREQAQMEAWRFEDTNKGFYELIPELYSFIGGWTWTDSRPDVEDGAWSWSDLDFDRFKGKKVSISNDADNRGEPSLDDNIHPYQPEDQDEDDKETVDMGILSSIPTMNNYIRQLETYNPDISTWDNEDKAARELLDDIKTSRSGCLSIPVTIFCDVMPWRAQEFEPNPDYVPPFDEEGNQNEDHDPTVPEELPKEGTGPCSIREDFTINLYLKDSLDDPNEEQASFALPFLKKVGVRKDSTGRSYGSKVDGDSTSPEQSDLGSHVAADIDLYYNEYTGSYQSGNRTILAKITKTVGNAFGAEDIEALESSDNNETLNDLDDNYLQMGTGEAMPITMQNANPFQWTPNYATPADCRNGDTTKQKVIVYNADPEKSFAVGKTVLLHEVDGKWFPIEFGSGESQEFVPEPIFKGRWEFQQFLTNAGNFFCLRRRAGDLRDIDGGSYNLNGAPYGDPTKGVAVEQFSPDQYEKHFHRGYYSQDDYNNGSDSDPVKYAGDAGLETDVDLEQRGLFISNVRQVTGFDYLENRLGGTRGEKRSINRTVFGQYGDGSLIETDDGTGGESPENTVYFGAVFPDGYVDSNIDTDDQTGPSLYQQKTRSFDVRSCSWHAAGETRFFNNDGIDGNKEVFPHTKKEDRDRTAYTSDGRVWSEEGDDADVKICLFGDYLAKGNSNYAHLPADYATHCSPSGVNGRPIMDLNFLNTIGKFFGEARQDAVSAAFGMENATGFGFNPLFNSRIDEVETNFVNVNALGFGMYHWLYKRPDGGWPEIPQDDPSADKKYLAHFTNSAFDFRPVRANHIQFRPCQMELFANHQEEEGEFVTGFIAQGQPGAGDNPNRDTIINYLSNKMDDKKTALSFNSIKVQKSIYTVDQSLDTYNAVFTPVDKQNYNLKQTFGQLAHCTDFSAIYYDHFHATSSRYGFHNKYNTNTREYRKQRDGGLLGVGVIGSVCTVGAVQAINFTTQQTFGMQSAYLNTRWYPQWGGSTYNKYDKFGTTDLSVRIYQAHERENLIYDSRFFAVHHFNAGTRVSTEAKKERFVDTDGDNKLDAKVDTTLTPVDLVVPSYVDFGTDCVYRISDAILNPNRVPISASAVSSVISGGSNKFKSNDSDSIFKDTVLTTSDEWHRLIPSGFWNVDGRRRGRLLPLNYEATLMQSPYFGWGENHEGGLFHSKRVWVTSEKIEHYDEIAQAFAGAGDSRQNYALEIDNNGQFEANPQDLKDVDLVIRNLGKDYKVGDTFKINGFQDSKVTVSQVGTGGCVIGLTFNIDKDRRSDFDLLGTSVDLNVLATANPNFGTCEDILENNVDDFDPSKPEEQPQVTKSTSTGAKLKPFNKFSVSGKGFDAFVTRAVLRKYLRTDAKPKIATIQEFYQLSLPADTSPGGPAGETALGAVLNLFGLGSTSRTNNFIPVTRGQRLVQADILPQNASSDGLYDCFFHFHNDIQHTVLNNDNVASAHKSHDQYIDLTINPV